MRLAITMILMISLTMVVLIASTFPSPSGSIKISGKFEYIDEFGGNKPMRQVKVYLMDDDMWEGSPTDEMVAWQYTNDDGSYSFTANNEDGFTQDGRDPYVIVESSNVAAIVQSPWLGVYTLRLPKAADNVADGFTHDYGTVNPTSDNEAWQVLDTVLTERNWLLGQVGWERPTKVTINWPYGLVPLSYGDKINLPPKSLAGWDKLTIYHLYGLSVLYSLYGNSFPVGWTAPLPPHPVFLETNDVVALVEGWADFLQAAVENNPDNLEDWKGGHGGDIETNDWFNCIDVGDMDGNIVEGSVASVFWDIWDPVNDDPLSLGLDELFYIIRDYKPADFNAFWNRWVSRYPLYAGDLCTIAWMYGIDKDTYPPTGTIVINSDDAFTTSTSVTLTISAYDYGSGLAYMRFSNFPNAGYWGRWYPWVWSSWYPYATSASWTLTTGDGLKTVTAQFKDRKGLVTPISSLPADTIILDTVPPTGSIVINSGDKYTTSTSVTLYLSYFDATSGVDKVRYSNDGVWDTETWESPSATKAWTLTGADGTKTVYYQVRDKAGLISATYIDTIVLDRVPPTGSIVINDDDPYTGSVSVTLTLTYSDDTSGVDKVRYANDGEAWKLWEAPSGVKLWTLRAVDGTRTVYYQVRDKAGLISATYSDTILLDTTPPVTTIHHTQGTAWIWITSVDPAPGTGVAVTYYRIDGGAWIEYTGSFTVPGTGGTRRIDAYSIDFAGNKEVPSQTLKVHYLTVSASRADLWTPSGSGWYTEGTTVWTPNAPSYVDKTTYTPVYGDPVVTRYTFSTWKKDLGNVAGDPISVLMNAPHWVTATYFGCEMIVVDEGADWLRINLRVTTGTTEYVKFYYTFYAIPDIGYSVRQDLFQFPLPGGLDFTYAIPDIPLPAPPQACTYYITIYAEDATTGTVLGYSQLQIDWV